jgi:hypothetical protein
VARQNQTTPSCYARFVPTRRRCRKDVESSRKFAGDGLSWTRSASDSAANSCINFANCRFSPRKNELRNVPWRIYGKSCRGLLLPSYTFPLPRVKKHRASCPTLGSKAESGERQSGTHRPYHLLRLNQCRLNLLPPSNSFISIRRQCSPQTCWICSAP